jgi:hypothetical protein
LLEFERVACPCCLRHVVLLAWIESHGKGYVSRGQGQAAKPKGSETLSDECWWFELMVGLGSDGENGVS